MNAMQPPQSIEEIKAGLETTEKGGVRQSIRNCLTVFQRDPLLSGAIAYNILTDRKDIIKPIGFHRESTALNDTDMKYLLLYLEETYGLTNEKKIDNAIGIVANENKYHPIRDYPYVWGGSSPATSFDCSGFVSWVINHSGWNVGRLGAQGLYNICTPTSNPKPGDLVFFVGTYDTAGVSHCGIYVGDGMMIHCGDPIQYANLNTSYWQSHFYAYGRLP